MCHEYRIKRQERKVGAGVCGSVVELERNFREVESFTITEKAPTRAFS